MTTIVSPGTVEQAAEALTAAAADGHAVRFVGSGGRRELGRVDREDIWMGASAMGDVIDWPVEDLTIVVGAGMTVGELETLLATENQTSLLPADEPNRTVGGLVAEGASGYRRLKYGPTRDRVLEVTMATGYGRVIRGGGRLVKNVTGYDLPRLVTGSLGSLGFIGTVCLKLWPVPPVVRAVAIGDPIRVQAELFRPAAVLETEAGSVVLLEGSPSDVAAQIEAAGSIGEAMLPSAIASTIRISVRIPPRHLASTLEQVRNLAPERFVAQHGVGVIDVGFDDVERDAVFELRTHAESVGGSVVVVRSDTLLGGIDPWGAPGSTIGIQQRLKALFDPWGVCNPGILPGGI